MNSKSSLTALALASLLAAPLAQALAQAPAPRPRSFLPGLAGRPAAPAPGLPEFAATPSTKAPAPKDPKVFEAATALPTPTPVDEIKAPTIALPDDPIEPYLLTKEAGPFMVIARTFRGPDAGRYALALVLELRRDYHLPAYILRTRDFPKNSNIHGVPPTAPPYINQAHLTMPEKVRTYDEAMVLVGDEKTINSQEKLWHDVKKIKPKCLDGLPTLFGWREGLGKALKTNNPLVPAQNIYPGRKRDPLIVQMNEGPRSIQHCPGRYSLQVAEFGGRASFNPQDTRFQGNGYLKKSPLATAADDAEKLAEGLAKDPEVRRTGYQPYVYHDRTSSKVMIGAFNDPRDPAALQLRQMLVRRAIEMSNQTKTVIAPGLQLTDLEPIKTAN